MMQDDQTVLNEQGILHGASQFQPILSILFGMQPPR